MYSRFFIAKQNTRARKESRIPFQTHLGGAWLRERGPISAEIEPVGWKGIWDSEAMMQHEYRPGLPVVAGNDKCGA